jgi:hypothetical protein
MTGILKRAASKAAFFVGIMMALLLAAYLYFAQKLYFENLSYAGDVFANVLPESKILETKRWHGVWPSGWGCSYAIVADISGIDRTELPSTPPGTHWQLAYGGNWQPTPAPPLGDTTRDAIDACRDKWDPNTANRIETALATPGAWFSRDSVGEPVHLYAPNAGIAARVRYGD